MKKVLFLLLISLSIYSCNNSKKNGVELKNLIPKNSSLVLKIDALEAFRSDLKNNDFISKLSSNQAYKSILSPLELLDSIQTDSQILICFETNNETLEYSIITKYHDSLFNNIETDSLNIYSKIIDSVYVGSTSKLILNNIKLNESSKFESLFETTTNSSSFSVFMTDTGSNRLGTSIIPDDITAFSSLMSLDAEISQDQITFNGVSIAYDTLPQLINVFKNTIPQENTIQNIVPYNSTSYLSFTFNDFDVLNLNLSDYNERVIDSTANYDLFHSINEVGEIHVNKETVVILKSIDAFATKEVLQDQQTIVSNYRNVDILEFTQPTLFKTVFSPFIGSQNISNYINIEDFFVFANSENVLQDIISNFQNGTTLGNQNSFINSKESLSDEASLLVVANPSKLKEVISSLFNEDLSNLKLNDYKTSAIQFVQDDDFVHVNGIIKKNKSRAQLNSVTEEFNVSLEADILTKPHIVTNHRTKQKEIVVQDINNNLYLISNKGKILWKKRLHGSVLGKIEQIDIYKNGRLQLVFATPHRVYVLDRLGRDVSPFPGKFNDEITQPLSVFDYDNNKNYRLVVTQGRHILMYDVNSKPVRGFTFKSAANTINHQPQHFRIGRKDYILIKTENKLHVLDRTGRTRITPKTSSSYSNEAIYVYNNKFTTTSKKGDLITIDGKGNTGIQNLNLSDQHNIVATSKTLVTLSDNNLSIKQKAYELDFGNYTAPKIFYLNDKIYVTLTDLQTQKVYLFDSQSKLINNFPVYGNSSMDLANIDSDNKLEFVVKGESNSVIVYKKN